MTFVPIGNTTTLSGSTSLNSGIVTDFNKATKNMNNLVWLKLPYWDENGNLVEDVLLCGFMTSGFGWSISNSYTNLLDTTSAQLGLTSMLQSTGYLASGLLKNADNNSILGQIKNRVSTLSSKSIQSLQQTVSLWVGMQKPTFSIEVLFFDGKGRDETDVRRAAYTLEKALYPKIDTTVADIANATMTAPMGYAPKMTGYNQDGTVNWTGGMEDVTGTVSLKIGAIAFFPALIYTACNLGFSDIMLDNGHPQWLRASLSFGFWRQPTLEDLNYRYTG